MNQKETLALWQQGKDAWNAWARGMLAERKSLEESGEWAAQGEKWKDKAKANFRSSVFTGEANFVGHVFPGDVEFMGAEFSGNAAFSHAIFLGFAGLHSRFSGSATFVSAKFFGVASFVGAQFSEFAGFGHTTFSGDAMFDHAIFFGKARLNRATFRNAAQFDHTEFHKDLTFHSSVFEKLANLGQARFCGDTTFWSMRADEGFDLEGTAFVRTPDFRQASFREAIGLDDVRIRVPITLTDPEGKAVTYTPPALTGDDAPRFRALRRMATQAGDHVREAEFFAQELRAHRGHADKWYTSARWWLGWGYQILSNFGRSVALPIVCMLNTWLWGAVIYACLGQDFQIGAALLFSAQNLAPVLFVGQDMAWAHKVLYGDAPTPWVDTLGALETLVGGGLLFLLILGARYTLRVR